MQSESPDQPATASHRHRLNVLLGALEAASAKIVVRPFVQHSLIKFLLYNYIMQSILNYFPVLSQNKRSREPEEVPRQAAHVHQTQTRSNASATTTIDRTWNLTLIFLGRGKCARVAFVPRAKWKESLMTILWTGGVAATPTVRINVAAIVRMQTA